MSRPPSSVERPHARWPPPAHRRVGNGLREDVVIRDSAGEPAACTVTVAVEADFADLFEVEEGRVQARGGRRVQGQGERLVFDQHWRDNHRGAVVLAPGGSLDAVSSVAHSAGSIRYEVVVPARGQWTASLLVQPVVDGEDVEPSFPLDRPVRESLPARRLQRWQETMPIATTGHEGLQRVLRRSRQDLGALRIFDPVAPSSPPAPAFTPLRVEGVAVGDARIDLAVSADGAVVEEAPPGVNVRHECYRSRGSAA